eukprot:11287974-Alexandrium_andersonii.AAC.1
MAQAKRNVQMHNDEYNHDGEYLDREGASHPYSSENYRKSKDKHDAYGEKGKGKQKGKGRPKGKNKG